MTSFGCMTFTFSHDHVAPGPGKDGHMPDRAEWQLAEVVSPHLVEPVPVIAAKDIPYVHDANRLQNLSIYVPMTAETIGLVGAPVERLPDAGSASLLPRYYVHVHGGAWRDPGLTAASVEPTVAHAFSAVGACI